MACSSRPWQALLVRRKPLLERAIPPLLSEQYRVAVVAGDGETDRDVRRMAALDVPVVQIITNGTRYLEARMISDALRRMDLEHFEDRRAW